MKKRTFKLGMNYTTFLFINGQLREIPKPIDLHYTYLTESGKEKGHDA